MLDLAVTIGREIQRIQRWLERQGAVFVPRKSGSSHYRVTLNGITTIFPHHGSKEMGKHLESEIKKQLGLK